MTYEIHICPETHRIEAVFYAQDHAPIAVRFFTFLCNLLPKDGVADGPLTERWGCCVLCSREFSNYWRQREGRPAPAFLLSTQEVQP